MDTKADVKECIVAEALEMKFSGKQLHSSKACEEHSYKASVDLHV